MHNKRGLSAVQEALLHGHKNFASKAAEGVDEKFRCDTRLPDQLSHPSKQSFLGPTPAECTCQISGKFIRKLLRNPEKYTPQMRENI